MTEPINLASILTLDDFQDLARTRLSHLAYEYVAGGVGDECTVAENRTAFNRIRLRPRILIDVSRIDTTLTLFARNYPHPILLAPTGYHKLVHPEGELETVKGADLSHATLVSASFATTSFGDMRAASQSPLWFQLYIHPDRSVTRDLVERVLAAGCEAMCLTVDAATNGPRDRELRAGFHLPEGTQRANFATLGPAVASAADRSYGRDIYSALRTGDATWKDLDWLRAMIPVPLLLKGALHPDDSLRAVEAGCDGLIVSNHGGRSVDTVPSTMEVLALTAQRLGGRVPLLLDGGIRRGTDIFKALAYGATAILIGRPYLYGLSVGGAQGIARVVEILRTELEMTMGLTGCPKLSEISPEYLWP